MAASALFGFDACFLDSPAPAVELLSYVLAELLRRAGRGLGEELRDALLDDGLRERLVGLGIQRMDDVIGRAGRREDAKPGRKVEALESRSLRNGGNLGNQRRALGA